MSFGITGFGAVQLTPSPRIFQALSLGGQPPVAPAPPYGFVNPNALVPVARTGNPAPAVPANLTLAAHATFQAILRVSQTVVQTGQYPLPQQQSFTKTALGATIPTLNAQTIGPVPPSIPVVGGSPQGPVSFSLTAAPASIGSAATLVANTLQLLEQGQRPASTAPSSGSPVPGAANPPTETFGGGSGSGSTLAVSPAGAVAQIVSTVKNLAIGAVYSSPVFSFSA